MSESQQDISNVEPMNHAEFGHTLLDAIHVLSSPNYDADPAEIAFIIQKYGAAALRCFQISEWGISRFLEDPSLEQHAKPEVAFRREALVIDDETFDLIVINGDEFRLDNDKDTSTLEKMAQTPKPVSPPELQIKLGGDMMDKRAVENLEDNLYALSRRGIVNIVGKKGSRLYEINPDPKETNKDKLRVIVDGVDLYFDEFEELVAKTMLRVSKPVDLRTLELLVNNNERLSEEGYEKLGKTVRRYFFKTWVAMRVPRVKPATFELSEEAKRDLRFLLDDN